MMSVHATVPKIEVETTSVGELMRSVIEIAWTIMGVENATRAADIMVHKFGLKHKGTDQPLRKAMKIALREKNIPFVSNTSGFFLARDRDELSLYRKSLVSRIAGMTQNLHAIDRILAQEDIHEHLKRRVPRETAQQRNLGY